MATRGESKTGESWVGGYPYKAVVTDFKLAQKPAPYGGTLVQIWGVVSFPLDIIFDTILLVPDMILWPFGFVKGGVD